MISNVNSSNNKFYFDKNDMEIVIPKRSYEVQDSDKYLKRAILNFRPDDIAKKKTHLKDEDEESKYKLMIHANNNTMKSEIKYILLNLAILDHC